MWSDCEVETVWISCTHRRHRKVASLQAGAKKAPRPAKPENHRMIVDWFVTEERERVGVQDPSTGSIVPWFHGRLVSWRHQFVVCQLLFFLIYIQSCGVFFQCRMTTMVGCENGLILQKVTGSILGRAGQIINCIELIIFNWRRTKSWIHKRYMQLEL